VEKIGRTSYGTPVWVNKAVKDSDVVIGVGGIYPNHTAGFGGGSKLALGILGIDSRYHLHFRHKGIFWGDINTDITFRRELDEIAKLIGMDTTISLIIDADRNIIKMYSGDQRQYFSEAVSFYHELFCTAKPESADVVISNTYPNDLSLTFARMKGFVPLSCCGKGVSKIAIASCNEGLGLHNIWPFINVPRFQKVKHYWRLLSVMSLGKIIGKIFRKICRVLQRVPRSQLSDDLKPLNPVWLYRTGDDVEKLPTCVPGINITSDWSEILEAVSKEQSNRENLKVLVYPCAFLQLPNR
jgi:hypothetical protein